MTDNTEAAAKTWTVREQTIYDQVSGLIIQFTVGKDGLSRLRLFGKLPFGNREIGFGTDGLEAFAGVALSGTCGLPENLDRP